MATSTFVSPGASWTPTSNSWAGTNPAPTTPTAPNYGSGVTDLLGASTVAQLQNINGIDPKSLTGLDQVSPTALQDYGLAAQDRGVAAAQGIMQTGDYAEATSYGNAASIANANARLATVSGQIQQSQEGIKIYKEISGQQADVAGAGFGNSGSAIYLMRASAAQGALANQLIGTNAELASGGYSSQAAASQAQADAANATAAEAGQLAQNANDAATNATAQGNLAQALSLNTAAAAPGGSLNPTPVQTGVNFKVLDPNAKAENAVAQGGFDSVAPPPPAAPSPMDAAS
jgi:hypothetical protein